MLKKIILASKSIDRQEILSRAEIPFEIFIANVNEDKFKDKIKNPVKLVKKLAEAKVIHVKKQIVQQKIDAIIIAADTIVEYDKEIIGKAKNEDMAFQILKKLQNRSHNLLTGIAITESNSPKLILDYEKTVVKFATLSDKEIWAYIKTGEWKGRAGAYSIRDKASIFVESIEGSFTNVVGLPIFKIYEILKREFNFNLIEIKKNGLNE